MIQSGLPKAYWSYVVTHTIYLIDRLSSSVINYKTPYDLIYKSPPTSKFENFRFSMFCIYT